MAKDLFEAENIQPRDLFEEENVGNAIAKETQEKKSRGLMSETMKLFNHALKQGSKFLTNIPGQLKGIGEEFNKDPWGETGHFAGQLGVGLAEGAKSIANLGLSALTPLSELGGIPEGGHPFKYQIPETTGLQKALGLESNKKGDELVKEIPDIAALTTGLYGVAKSGGKFLSKTLPQGAEKARRNSMTEAIINSAKEHGASKEQLKALQDSLAESFTQKHRSEPGSMTPSKQRQKANIKEGDIEKLRESANIPEKRVPELPFPPDKEKIMDRVRAAKEEATRALSSALKSKEEHPLKAGRIISKHLKTLHDASSNLYNKVEKGYKGVDIPVDNTKKINETALSLDKLIQEDLASGESLSPGYGSGTSEQKALEDKIKSLQVETVKASDVYDVQRTLQNRAQKARDASFKSGLDKIERTRLQKLAAKHESIAIKLSKVLEKVGDPETKEMLKEANEGWRIYKDISRSKVGKSILRNEGKIPANTMFKITGTGKGNAHLRKLIESDPELSNYILGQKYSKPSAHKELLEGNDTVDSYIKRSSDVQDKITKLRVALKNVSEGKSEYKEAKTKYTELKNSITKIAEEQKTRADALNQIEKLTAERKSHLEASTQLEKKIGEAKSKGENTAKLEEDFARHKREYNDKGSRMDKLKKIALKYAGAKIGYESIVHKNSH